jgi:hypothetical protein
MIAFESGVTFRIIWHRIVNIIGIRSQGKAGKVVESGHCATLLPFTKVAQYILATLDLSKSNGCRVVAKTIVYAAPRQELPESGGGTRFCTSGRQTGRNPVGQFPRDKIRWA